MIKNVFPNYGEKHGKQNVGKKNLEQKVITNLQCYKGIYRNTSFKLSFKCPLNLFKDLT